MTKKVHNLFMSFFVRVSLVLILFVPMSSYANKKNKNIVTFVVSENQVPIYLKPSFDSRVLKSVNKKTKLFGLEKRYSGPDGWGGFYKVRLAQGVVGYLPDHQARQVSGNSYSKSKPVAQKRGYYDSSSRDDGQRRTASRRQNSYENSNRSYSQSFDVSNSRTIGAIGGMFQYKVGIAKEYMPYAGLQVWGKNWFNKKSLWSLDLGLGLGVPEIVKQILDDPSGTIAILKFSMDGPLSKLSSSSMIYYGLGVGLEGSFLKGTKLGQPDKYSVLRGGGLLKLGFAKNFDKWNIKLEPYYYLGSTQHTGVQIGLQRIF